MSTEVRLSREMRLIDITMIGVGAMIGAGIFVLTGIAAGVAGPALVLVFLLNGVVALLTAMAYAELGSAFHDAGGGYLWVKTSLPDPNGFLSGWMSWFAHAVACSLYALGFGAYFELVLRAFHLGDVRMPLLTLDQWLAVATVVLFSWINFRGASETGKAGNVVTVGKIVIIGLFIAAGLLTMFGRPDWHAAFEPFMSSGWTGVFAAMGLTFIAFEGYEIIAQTSEEVENPKKNVPRAVFLSMLIVVPIYLLVALVAIGAVHAPTGMAVSAYLGQEKEVALVTAANQFVTGGGVVLLIGGLLSTLSALNATVYSSSRVAFAMARDANLPQTLARVHSKRATPHIAILSSSVLILVMAVALPIEQVAAAADIMFLLLFVQVNVAVIRLRKSRPDLDRGFRIPLMPLTPILGILSMLFLAYFLTTHYPAASIAAAVWIGAGAAVYYAYSRKRETAFVERKEWMDRIERKEYRVLVAISHPKSVESLVAAGAAIARGHNGELILLYVAEVPEGVSLMTGRSEVRAVEPMLDRAVEYARELGVEAYPVITIGRRVSWAIVEVAREEECNFLVLGRTGTQSFLERIIASVVERVLEDSPCQVGVLYGTLRREGVKQILVPVTASEHSKLAVELAPAFEEFFDASARAVNIVLRGTSEAEGTKQTEAAQKTIEDAGLSLEVETLVRRDVARGIVGEVRRGHLVLLGAPSSGPVTPIFGDTVPMGIASRGRCPVLVVRDVEEESAHRYERLFFGRS